MTAKIRRPFAVGLMYRGDDKTGAKFTFPFHDNGIEESAENPDPRTDVID